MYNSLSVKYFILTARKTPALVGRLAGEHQPIILAILAALSLPVWMICCICQFFGGFGNREVSGSLQR